MKKPVIGIIGLGNMGGAMAANLLAQGFEVHVHDVQKNKQNDMVRLGAFAHANGAWLAMFCVAVIICVVDADQVEAVLFGKGGAAEHLNSAHTVLLCPTIAPVDTERFAARLAAQGVAVIDAPMSGGPQRARDGTMSLMLAAPDEVIERNAVLLAALSNKRFVVSQRVGDGARTKLVNNLLAGINLVGAAEALAMAQRLGLDLPTTLGVIEQSSGQSWIGTDRMQRVLANGGAGDYAPRAHMTLLQKDTALAVTTAHAAGFTGPLGQGAAAVFAQASAAGFAQEDDAAVFKLLAGSPPTIQRQN